MSDDTASPLTTSTGPWTELQNVQVVRIRLSDDRAAPQPDPLGRTRVGFRSDLTPAELWERARGVWKTKLTSLAETTLAVIVHEATVVGVGTVEAIRPLDDRVAIDGRPVVDHPLIGQRDPLHNTSRNPITYGPVSTVLPATWPARAADTVLMDAIAVLTEAARLRRPTMRPVEIPEDGNLRNIRWEVDPDRTEPADWAEFVTLALAGATANIGGIDAALTGRSGSWEAAGVRSLLESTVGPDENDLWRHRTEPLTITLFIEDLVDYRTRMWQTYYTAEEGLRKMYDDSEAANPPIDLDPYMWRYERTIADDTVGPWVPVDPEAPEWTLEAWRSDNDFGGSEEARDFFEAVVLGQTPELSRNGDPSTVTYLARSPELRAEYDRLDDERAARLDVTAVLEERLEEQRQREVAAYGQALKERIEAAALALPGLVVPVVVDLAGSSQVARLDDLPDVAQRLIERAVMDTPTPDDLPGTPLSRLLEPTASP